MTFVVRRCLVLGRMLARARVTGFWPQLLASGIEAFAPDCSTQEGCGHAMPSILKELEPMRFVGDMR
jgi:hypothetical protein